MPVFGVRPHSYRWIWSFEGYAGKTSVTFGTAGRVFLSPVYVIQDCIVDGLTYEVGATSLGNVRLGLYREGATTENPTGGALVVETAAAAQDASTRLQVVSVSDTPVSAGRYWIGIQGSSTTGTHGRLSAATVPYAFYFDNAGGFGAFANPCPALTAGSYCWGLGLRVKTNLPHSIF